MSDLKFCTYDIILLYDGKSFIDIKDLYIKLTNNYLLKVWYEEIETTYSVYNKKTTDELNKIVFDSIQNSQIVLICLTKSFLAIERFIRQFKFTIDCEKPCVIILFDKIDVNDAFKNIFSANKSMKFNQKLQVIDFYQNFNITFQKWSDAAFDSLLEILNDYLLDSSGFIAFK